MSQSISEGIYDFVCLETTFTKIPQSMVNSALEKRSSRIP